MEGRTKEETVGIKKSRKQTVKEQIKAGGNKGRFFIG